MILKNCWIISTDWVSLKLNNFITQLSQCVHISEHFCKTHFFITHVTHQPLVEFILSSLLLTGSLLSRGSSPDELETVLFRRRERERERNAVNSSSKAKAGRLSRDWYWKDSCFWVVVAAATGMKAHQPLSQSLVPVVISLQQISCAYRLLSSS